MSDKTFAETFISHHHYIHINSGNNHYRYHCSSRLDKIVPDLLFLTRLERKKERKLTRDANYLASCIETYLVHNINSLEITFIHLFKSNLVFNTTVCRPTLLCNTIIINIRFVNHCERPSNFFYQLLLRPPIFFRV